MFYYLQQCFAKWDRGLELLRSVSKRQGPTAAGYETMRFIRANYSIISRMEAVHVRDASLRLYGNCTHLKKPSEIIRHLEDEFSKAEMKLSNFPDLMLKEPDRVSVLLQAIPNEVRQYVVLHGKSGKWDDLVDSCKFYEQQLRMVDAASIAGSGKENAVEKTMPKASKRVMEKGKMVESQAMERARKRASRREMGKAKTTERERKRNLRKRGAIGTGHQ